MAWNRYTPKHKNNDWNSVILVNKLKVCPAIKRITNCEMKFVKAILPQNLKGINNFCILDDCKHRINIPIY